MPVRIKGRQPGKRSPLQHLCGRAELCDSKLQRSDIFLKSFFCAAPAELGNSLMHAHL